MDYHIYTVHFYIALLDDSTTVHAGRIEYILMSLSNFYICSH